MEKLSEITKDYLEDIGVLAEARAEFETQMAEWWNEIFTQKVKPTLLAEFGGVADIWENKSVPGKCHWRTRDGSPVFLGLVDPRVSNRHFYTVSLEVASAPNLKEIVRQGNLVKSMTAVAEAEGILRGTSLNWQSRNLLSIDIQILADDPEETARQVCDTCLRYSRVVLEYSRASGETPV